MRITKVNIPKELIKNGLETVKMHRLGHVVILTGKNGSGKSRLLNLISNTLTKKPKISQIDQTDREILNYKSAITQQKSELTFNESKLLPLIDGPAKVATETKIASNKHNISVYENELQKRQEILSWNLIETNKLYEHYTIVPFMPKSLDLQDSNILNKNQLKKQAKEIDSIGVNSLANGTFARIQLIQERFFNSTHQNAIVTEEEKNAAIDDYNKLKDLIKIFLNTDLERNIDGEPTIFGFPLGQSNLSDGQKVLIQFVFGYSLSKYIIG